MKVFIVLFVSLGKASVYAAYTDRKEAVGEARCLANEHEMSEVDATLRWESDDANEMTILVEETVLWGIDVNLAAPATEVL